MNIFSALFGDPMRQQAAVSRSIAIATAKLRAARAAGDKPAELAALAEMRRLAAAGKAKAGRALKVVAVGSAVGDAAGAVGDAAGRLLTSAPVLLAGAAIVALLALRK